MERKQTLQTLVPIAGFFVLWTFTFYFYNNSRNPLTAPPVKEVSVVGVLTTPFVKEVSAVGELRDRVATFSAFLSSFRVKVIKNVGKGPWKSPSLRRLHTVFGDTDYYTKHLSDVQTFVLPWLINNSASGNWSSLNDHTNLLIQRYYGWTADEKLCSWMKIPVSLKTPRRYHAEYCSSNISDSLRPLSLQPKFYGGKRIVHNSHLSNGSDHYALLYIHIHRDALVSQYGDVISGNIKLVLPQCRRAKHSLKMALPGNLKVIPLHKELFVATHVWGNAYFHRMVEVVPRFAAYRDFLKKNPEIRILVSARSDLLTKMLKIIGLRKPRLVTGVCRAKIVYQPKSPFCGDPNMPENQILSGLFRAYIKRNFHPQPRNRLILIRRSKTRILSKQKEIEKVLKRAARDYNLTYTLFIDNPSPTLQSTMIMFNSAVVIVAPHGAGEANTLFSQPGTFVVEGVCNPPYINLLYKRLAYILGHRWHGIMSRGGCIRRVNITAASVDNAVRRYLRMQKLHKSQKS